MLKLRFLFLGLLICPFFSFSQNNFFDGYVVTLKGDTLVGYVKANDVGSTPKQIQFKVNDTAPIQQFSTGNCVAFGLYGRDFYERYTVEVSLSRTKIRELSAGIDTASKRDAVFLKVLQKGKNIALYVYTDEIKTRFYVKEHNVAEPVELLFYSYYNPNKETQIINRSLYQSQLLMLSKKYNVPVDEFRLERSTYSKESIVKIVSLVNDYREEEKPKSKSKYTIITFYGGVGLSRLATKFSGERFLVGSEVTSKDVMLPFISAGADIYINPASGKTFFRLEAEVSLSTSKHTLSTPENDVYELKHYGDKYEFEQYSGTFSVSLLRNLNNSDKQRFYAGLGVAMRFASTKKNMRTFSYTPEVDLYLPGLELKNTVLQVPISAGVVLFKKLDASFTYVLPSSLTNAGASAVKLNKLKFGLNYRF